VKKSCYKEYLEKIIEEGEFGYGTEGENAFNVATAAKIVLTFTEEVSDILARHKTLKDANKDLMKLSDEQDAEVNEMRRNLQALKTEAQNKLLVGNSVLHSYQKELEQVRNKAKVAEEDKDELEDKKKDISRESSQVIQAIRNIFSRCQASMRNKNTSIYTSANEATTLTDNLIMNLDVISGRIVDLIEICTEYDPGASNGGLGDLGEPSTSSASTTMKESKSQLLKMGGPPGSPMSKLGISTSGMIH
jgi:predicted RNase H-like nuclease (RuvC/YqgF family)